MTPSNNLSIGLPFDYEIDFKQCSMSEKRKPFL